MSRSKRHSRAGYVLVMFAMLTFALFGLAALVIDLGMVRLTQRQMQSAADGAALEGLLLRDQNPNVAAGSSPNQFDQARRTAAAQLVANMFDDDLNPATAETGNFGAGPILDLEDIGRGGSDPSLAASRLLVVPPAGQRTYLPTLQSNPQNSPEGDMVAGAYGPNASYPTDGRSENATYARQDFTPSSAPSGTEKSFLVRLRRTNDLQGLDNESGVSSSGPTVPFLFARGSTIHKDAASDYSPREQGMTVRAAAIASVDLVNGTQFGLVKSVGAPVIGNNNSAMLPGAAPFGIGNSKWTLLATQQTVSIDGQGQLIVAGGTVGFVIEPSGIGRALSLGQVLANAVAANPSSFTLATFLTGLSSALPPTGSTVGAQIAYAPIFDDSAGGTSAILGFGALQVNVVAGTFTLVSQTAFIGLNTSASLMQTSIATALTTTLLEQHRIWGISGSSLLAPVLASTSIFPPMVQP